MVNTERTMPISKVERLRRITSNLCTRCGLVPPPDGRKQCEGCRAYVNNCYKHSTKPKRSLLKKHRVSIGLCRCGRQARKDHTNCDNCANSQNKSVKLRTIKAVANNICSICKKQPSLQFKLTCEKCREIRRARTIEYKHSCRLNGKCTACGHRPSLPNKSNCQRCTDRQTAYYDKLRRDAFDAYGGPVCRCCGETIIEFLTIDHINGDGYKHRQEIGGGILRWLRNNGYPEGFQILCMNCNFGKRNGRECPHKRTLTTTNQTLTPQSHVPTQSIQS